MSSVNKGYPEGKGDDMRSHGTSISVTNGAWKQVFPKAAHGAHGVERNSKALAHQMKCAVDGVASPVVLDPGLALDLPQ